MRWTCFYPGILISALGFVSVHAFTPSEDRALADESSRHQIEILKRLDRTQTNRLFAGRGAEYFASGTRGSLSAGLPEALGFYPEAYGFDRLSRHSRTEWGIFTWRGFDIFTLKVSPLKPNGKLVIFNHGYLDHIGRYSTFIDKLARQGYTVVTYDLPGHGLSGGENASITDFKIYAEILANAVEQFSPGFNETILAGFSTGGSAILQARMYGLIDPKLPVVLVSPLIRIKYWQVAEPAFMTAFYLRYANNWSVLDLLIAPATQVNEVTSDELFLESHRLDPLRPAQIPSRWTYSYVRYASTLKKWADGLTHAQKAAFGPTLMLEGRNDSVVDGPLGVDFVTQTFPGSRIVWIPKGGHHLLNEGIVHFRKPNQAVDLLPLVYGPILEFLGSVR